MSNVTFGFIICLLSMAIFAAILLFGVGPLLAGHIALAILCAAMFGMFIGVQIIELED